MIIGTCSKCSGSVSVPDNWGSIIPPIPKCDCCGATKKQPYGPIIEMK